MYLIDKGDSVLFSRRLATPRKKKKKDHLLKDIGKLAFKKKLEFVLHNITKSPTSVWISFDPDPSWIAIISQYAYQNIRHKKSQQKYWL